MSLRSASTDNIRLWNVAEAGEPDPYGKVKSGVQFKIIPGHHGGFVSQMRTSAYGYSLAKPVLICLDNSRRPRRSFLGQR